LDEGHRATFLPENNKMLGPGSYDLHLGQYNSSDRSSWNKSNRFSQWNEHKSTVGPGLYKIDDMSIQK